MTTGRRVIFTAKNYFYTYLHFTVTLPCVVIVRKILENKKETSPPVKLHDVSLPDIMLEIEPGAGLEQFEWHYLQGQYVAITLDPDMK